MTVSKLICPDCHKVLKPSKPLPEGKKVTCPKCGSVFAAKEPPPDAIASKPKKAAARPGAAKAKKARRADKPIKPIEQRRRELYDEDDEDDDGGTYEVAGVSGYEGPGVNHALDMSIKDLRGPAQAAVVSPSNFLMLAGILGFFGWLGFMVVILIPIIFPLKDKDKDDKSKQQTQQVSPQSKDGKKEEKPSKVSFFKIWGIDFAELAEAEWYWSVLSVLGFVAGMIYCGVVTLGAVQMQNLESRSFGIVSCVMAVIPLNTVGFAFLVAIVLQIPLELIMDEATSFILMGLGAILCVLSAAAGLAAMFTLMREEVRAGFDYKAE